VIGTGGSISCIGDSRVDLLNYNYADKHLTIEEMVARIPEAGEIADIRAEQFLNVYGGDVTPSQWLQLARRIEQIFARITTLPASLSRTARRRWKKRRIFSILQSDRRNPS
jgi:L-asparaginase